MNTRFALAIAVLGLSLTACSAIGARPSASADPSASPTPSASPAPTDPASPSPSPSPSATPAPTGTPSGKLDGREFVSVLVTDNGKSKVLVPGTKIRLNFSDGMLGAHAGCNSMSGDYKVVDGKLVVGQMSTTEIGCPTNLGEQDQWLAAFLGAKPAVALNGNDLVLTSDDAEITLLDREEAEPDQPLTGITWGLSTLLDGETASSVPTGVTATLLFDDEGSFTFNDGCNAGGGKYALDGDRITFSEVITTDMACGGDSGPVESAIAAVFNADNVTYSIDHATLTLQAGEHGLMYDAALDVAE